MPQEKELRRGMAYTSSQFQVIAQEPGTAGDSEDIHSPDAESKECLLALSQSIHTYPGSPA